MIAALRNMDSTIDVNIRNHDMKSFVGGKKFGGRRAKLGG